MQTKNLRKVGNNYEDWAADHLRKQGYEIIERNFYCRSGEIDLVARESGYLVFVEVKYRSTNQNGLAAEAVNFAKQAKMKRAAMVYLQRRKVHPEVFCRFDVVAIDGTKIQLIRNAFQ